MSIIKAIVKGKSQIKWILNTAYIPNRKKKILEFTLNLLKTGQQKLLKIISAEIIKNISLL